MTKEVLQQLEIVKTIKNGMNYIHELLSILKSSSHYLGKETNNISEYRSELEKLTTERDYHVEQLRLIHCDINILENNIKNASMEALQERTKMLGVNSKYLESLNEINSLRKVLDLEPLIDGRSADINECMSGEEELRTSGTHTSVPETNPKVPLVPEPRFLPHFMDDMSKLYMMQQYIAAAATAGGSKTSTTGDHHPHMAFMQQQPQHHSAIHAFERGLSKEAIKQDHRESVQSQLGGVPDLYGSVSAPSLHGNQGGGNSLAGVLGSTDPLQQQQQQPPPMKKCQSCHQQIHRNAPICPLCKAKSRSINPKKPKKKPSSSHSTVVPTTVAASAPGHQLYPTIPAAPVAVSSDTNPDPVPVSVTELSPGNVAPESGLSSSD